MMHHSIEGVQRTLKFEFEAELQTYNPQTAPEHAFARKGHHPSESDGMPISQYIPQPTLTIMCSADLPWQLSVVPGLPEAAMIERDRWCRSNTLVSAANLRKIFISPAAV